MIMRYALGLSYSEFVNKLKCTVKLQDQFPLHFIPNLFLKDEFVGNIVGERIWLQKIQPGFFNFPGRYFSGEIENQENKSGIYVTGKFKFYMSNLILTILSISFVTIFFGLRLLKYDVEGIIINAIVIIFADGFMIGLLLLNIPLRRNCEAYVIQYLNNLEKLYPMSK